LVPALCAAYAGILENLDDLPTRSLCHRLKLPTLIVGVLLWRCFLDVRSAGIVNDFKVMRVLGQSSLNREAKNRFRNL
jgi:hypothetical protein